MPTRGYYETAEGIYADLSQGDDSQLYVEYTVTGDEWIGDFYRYANAENVYRVRPVQLIEEPSLTSDILEVL